MHSQPAWLRECRDKFPLAAFGAVSIIFLCVVTLSRVPDLAFGARNVPSGAESASLSMIWLVFAYLFHTLGELCLSPMGLSYLSKLIPARMIAFMFGVYYLAVAIGNKLAHYIGGDIDKITQEYSLSGFFLIFTIVPIALGVISLVLHPLIKRSMHGIR